MDEEIDMYMLMELMVNDPNNPKYKKILQDAWYDRMREALSNSGRFTIEEFANLPLKNLEDIK